MEQANNFSIKKKKRNNSPCPKTNAINLMIADIFNRQRWDE